MESYLSLALVTTAAIPHFGAKYQEPYRYSIGTLDRLLAAFPRDHSAPFNFRSYNDGVSCFCPSKQGGKAQHGSGTGVLGMMNSQQVPGLILQVLLCKC